MIALRKLVAKIVLIIAMQSLIIVTSIENLDIVSPRNGETYIFNQIVDQHRSSNITKETTGAVTLHLKSSCETSLLIWIINEENQDWPHQMIAICDEKFEKYDDLFVTFNYTYMGKNTVYLSANNTFTETGDVVSKRVVAKIHFFLRIQLKLLMEDIVVAMTLGNHPEVAYTITWGRGTRNIAPHDIKSMVRYVDLKPWSIIVGSFVSIAKGVQILLSSKGAGHRHDYITVSSLDRFRNKLFPDQFAYDSDENLGTVKRTLVIGKLPLFLTQTFKISYQISCCLNIMW